jgi:hypothetical protein
VGISGCSGSSSSLTQEDVALHTCTTALVERLHAPSGASPVQTQMIGERPSGWLVRGLSARVGDQPARNYECSVRTTESGPASLIYLRTCAAGESPWGCPDEVSSGHR